MRKVTRSLLGGAAVFGIATALVGCSSAEAGPDVSDGLQIVTTTTQLSDFTQNVTEGTGAEITGLLQPNASAHSFEANAADLEIIRTADVVIMNGVGLEPWLEDTLTSAGFEGLTIDASTGISESDLLANEEDAHDHAGEDEHDHAEESEADEHSHEEEADAHEHADEADAHEHEHEHAEETQSEDTAETPAAQTEAAPAEDTTEETDAHEGHDHGELNPHVWTSPSMAADMTTHITEELAALDEAQADTYLANGAAYTEQLTALDTWVQENIDTVPEADRLLVTNHDALTYFNRDYGITFIGSVMPSWDDNAEPSAAEIDALVAAIEESGVSAVFTETQLSPGTAEAIAQEAGVEVYSGDEALYTDALGEEGSAGATYISSTIHNTTQLLDSWGGAVTEPPAELQES
ncbi:MAG: metal ABC transporter substrate-binding protein [Gulosibacter sp.]|uniref:metal ABC transporter substrate-binding protein n=1 Tax=Gulosibacter sp. TaxID=2817531 RepID=UPI003F914A92